MNDNLERVISYANLVYRKLVETSFEFNDLQRLISKRTSLNSVHILSDNIKIQLNIIQNMLDTLKDELAGVGIYTDVLVIQNAVQDVENVDNIDLIKNRLEELKKHIENAEYLLKIMKNGDDSENPEKQKKENEIKEAILFGKELLLGVRVLEGKLDVITDCRPLVGTVHLHGIETYRQIQEIFARSEKLSPDIKRFQKLLKNFNINEKLEFSMDGQLENIQNYIQMLLIPELRIRDLLMEKYEEIRSVRKNIEKIIGLLQATP